MRSETQKLAKTLGIKLPEEYARFMEKYGRKLPLDPLSGRSWVLGLGNTYFVEGTTQAFRSRIPGFAPENIVIGSLGPKTIVLNRTYEQIDTYAMLDTGSGKVLSVDTLGVAEVIADSFQEWAGAEILAAELKEEYGSTLTVVLFNDELKAEEARAKILELQREGHIELEDVVSVVRQADGTWKHHRSHELEKKVGAVGSLTGLIAGALMLHPLLGAALGAAAGAITASMKDSGMEDDFVRPLAKGLKPGTSAIFTMVQRAEPEKVLEKFKGFGGEVLVASMDKEQISRLKECLVPQAA
jgi:uncharacterized membrane protein